MFSCVAENLAATITFHLLTPGVLEEPSYSSVEMEDEASVGPHNISSADTISVTSSMAAMDPMPSVHLEVSFTYC